MDYFGILKRAYQITLKHRFLWIFGILGGGYGGTRMANVSSFSGDTVSWDNFTSQTSSVSWETFWSEYGALILSLALVFIIFGIVALFLNIVSQAALIGSANKLAVSEKSDFADGFMIGWHNFWRVLAVGLSFAVLCLAAVAIWLIPTIVLASAGFIALAVIWGMLFLLVFLAFMVLIAIISPYALRVIVLRKLGIIQSIREGLHLVRDHLGKVTIMYLLLILANMVIGAAIVVAVILVGLVLFGVGYMFYLVTPILALIYGIIAAIAFLVAFFTLGGAYGAFTSSVLTLTYRELAK